MSTIADLCVGNADTEMAAGQKAGVLQPDGSIKAEATFDVKHVADAIVHIAGLPLDVTVLNFNIMSVSLCADTCVFSNLIYGQGFAHAVDWQRLIAFHRPRRFQQKSLVYLYSIKKICVRKSVECVYAILLQPRLGLLWLQIVAMRVGEKAWELIILGSASTVVGDFVFDHHLRHLCTSRGKTPPLRFATNLTHPR